MTTPQKSSVDQIRARFDADVERFSNLDTGQTATMDAALCMDLITTTAARISPHARDLLDIGCGAGNYTLKMLAQIPNLNTTLVDLSQLMLDRAQQRIAEKSTGTVTTLQSDMRLLNLGREKFDIILAASTLHHLRDQSQWHAMFQKIQIALRPAGSFWIFDLITHDSPAIEALQQERYANYLRTSKAAGAEGDAYQKKSSPTSPKKTPRARYPSNSPSSKTGFQQIETTTKTAPSQ